MSDLRTKIARAIHDNPGAQAQYVKAGIAPHGFENCRYSEQYFNDADAVLSVLDLDKVRAVAQVEALREAAVETERKRSEPGLVRLDVRYQGYYTGIRSGMESAMRLLREAADRIAREAGIDTEGNKTGEKNDG